MITFDHLSIQNFRSWQRLSLPLDNRGVVCVHGDTGAGKSSIFAALFWGLYGTLPDAVRADEVRREGARKPTIVRIRLTKDGHRYHIVRFRGSKEFKNKVLFTGHGIPAVVEDSHVKTVQGLIDQFLGVSPQTFLATTYFAQRNFHFFHSLTDQAKKAFLESLTYGSLFEACETESRQRVRTQEKDLARLEGQISGLDASIQALEHQAKDILEQLDRERERLVGRQQEVKDALATHRAVAESLELDVKRFHEVEAHVDDLETQRQQVQDDLQRLSTNSKPCPRCGLIMPENLIAERQHACSERYKALSHTLERTVAQRTRLASRYAQYQDRLRFIEELQQERTRLDADVQHNLRARRSVQSPAGLEEQLIALQKELIERKHTLAYTAFWVKGFGFQGLRSFVLANAIHYLSAQVERYLKRVMGERIEFAMVIEQTRLLTECNGRSYASLSGGERQAVDLCTGLAMRDLASRYAKSRFNLLVLDEPHEGLDKHLTAVAQGLLLDYQMPSTFLITHQDYAGHFDQLCTVSRHKGQSALRVLY